MYLSILVPVYNVGNYVRKCLDSIVAQTFTDFEAILVDDGSTDDSGKICDEYAARDARIKVIHKRNEGHVRARKTALEICKGTYVGIVDSDDWIEPQMYEKLCQGAKEHDADIVICGINGVRETSLVYDPGANAEGFFDKARLEREIYPTMLSEGEPFKFGMTPQLWNKIYRREIITQEFKKVDDRIGMGEDVASVYACLARAERVYIIHDGLYNYRVTEQSMTRRFKKGFFESNLRVFASLGAISPTENWDRQLDMYIIAMSYSSLLNEYRPENTKSGSQKYAAVTDYIKAERVTEAFADVDTKALRTYAKPMVFLIKHKLWHMLPILMKIYIKLLKNRAG